jgi:hypothetical protein
MRVEIRPAAGKTGYSTTTDAQGRFRSLQIGIVLQSLFDQFIEFLRLEQLPPSPRNVRVLTKPEAAGIRRTARRQIASNRRLLRLHEIGAQRAAGKPERE